MDKTIIIATLLGALIYFLMEFKSKKLSFTKDFSILYWLKDNWMNIFTTVACLYAYVYIKEGITKEMAFAIGFGWNKIQDYFQDFLSKERV